MSYAPPTLAVASLGGWSRDPEPERCPGPRTTTQRATASGSLEDHLRFATDRERLWFSGEDPRQTTSRSVWSSRNQMAPPDETDEAAAYLNAQEVSCRPTSDAHVFWQFNSPERQTFSFGALYEVWKSHLLWNRFSQAQTTTDLSVVTQFSICQQIHTWWGKSRHSPFQLLGL